MNYGVQAKIAEDREYSYTSDERQMKTTKRIKRPGFLARWFLKKLTEGAEYEKRQAQEKDMIDIKTLRANTISVNQTSIDQPDRAIQFTVYSANGGRVVETRRYDRQKDRSSNGLYVITNDQDFGHEIDKIITMESLK